MCRGTRSRVNRSRWGCCCPLWRPAGVCLTDSTRRLNRAGALKLIWEEREWPSATRRPHLPPGRIWPGFPLPDSYGTPARLDLPGVTLLTGGVVAIVWALVRGNQSGWGSAEIAQAA